MSLPRAMFSFNGRLARLPFFGYCVLLLFLCFLIGAAAAMIGPESRAGGAVLGLVLLATLVVVISCGLALTIKRLHDMGLTGTHAIWIYGLNVASLAVGPALSVLFDIAVGGVFLWLCLGAGQAQSNRYGPVPGAALLPGDLPKNTDASLVAWTGASPRASSLDAGEPHSSRPSTA
jgi:uncharacterized membrane protein YhaH (DUF805 family)